MRKEARVFLLDILECIDKIEECTNKVSKEKFLEETWRQDATLRRIEIIGEATKNIPQGITEKYPEIPWKKIAGMRDRFKYDLPT